MKNISDGTVRLMLAAEVARDRLRRALPELDALVCQVVDPAVVAGVVRVQGAVVDVVNSLRMALKGRGVGRRRRPRRSFSCPLIRKAASSDPQDRSARVG